MRRLFVVALFLAFPAFSPAQAPNPEKLAAIKAAMQKFVDSNDLAGAVTLVGRKDGIIHHEAVGFRNISSKDAMQKDTLFRIASMTKPVTALAIMILADDGKLNPDDNVAKYLPEFTNQMLIEKRDKGMMTLKTPSRPIKLRDLLTHTSGVIGSYPPGVSDVYAKRNRTLAETTLAAALQPLTFEPGTKWSYCNPGMDTLGRIVEVVSGESYESFLQKRIFDPVGMRDTTFYPTAEQMKRLAMTYSKGKDALTPVPNSLIGLQQNPKHPIPAGGLVSSAGDMAKLYTMMLNKGMVGDRRILSEQSWTTMTKVQTGTIATGFVEGMGFGFGWAVVREPKGVNEKMSAGTFGHGGAFGTQGWIDPTQDLFVVLMIQRSDLGNSDNSPMRKALQDLAVDAVRGKN